LYAYRCTQCGHRFERIQHFRSKPELVCPQCAGVLERPLTAPRLHFKGAGFYINDYAAKSAAPAADSAPAVAPAETKASAASSSAIASADATPVSAPATATTGSTTA
jgi:putative FmdB family regulatory protein